MVHIEKCISRMTQYSSSISKITSSTLCYSKLLKVARPLLDDAEFANTTALVEDFLKKVASRDDLHLSCMETFLEV